MNERSESFNERLVKELGGGSGGQISEVSRSGSCDVSFDRDLGVTNPILGLKISLEDFFVFFLFRLREKRLMNRITAEEKALTRTACVDRTKKRLLRGRGLLMKKLGLRLCLCLLYLQCT